MNSYVVSAGFVVSLMAFVPVRSSWCKTESRNISDCFVHKASPSGARSCFVPLENPFALELWVRLSQQDPTNLAVVRIQEIGLTGKRNQNLDFHIRSDLGGNWWHRILVKSGTERGKNATGRISYKLYVDVTEIASGSVDFVKAKFMFWINGMIFFSDDGKCVYKLGKNLQELSMVFARNDNATDLTLFE